MLTFRSRVNMVSLFNIPRVSKDAVLLCVFPFTLTGSAKRWVDRLTLGVINTWDLLKKPLSKGIVHHPRPLNDLKTSTTSSKKDINRYTKLGNGLNTLNRQLLDSQGPIPGMTPTQALTKIQTMADHSQKWHDGTSSRNVSSNSNTDGLAAIDLTLTKNVLSTRKSNSWKRSSMENSGALLLSTEKRPSLEELMNKHQEESARRSTEMKEWFMKLQENAKINNRNQSASLKNLETQIKQLTKELHSRTTNLTPISSTGQCKVVNDDHETQHRPISSRKLNTKEGWTTMDIQCQLPPKEPNPGNFTLPCTIGNFNIYGMANLGASVNVMPMNTFKHLRLANLRNTNMLVEMADMTKKEPLGIIKNILKTATYGKVKYREDEDDCFTNLKTKFPAIVFDDTLTSDTALSCESTVSPLNENEIDFRITFDESDDEDYMVIFNENSFSYKIISVDDLKTDSEKDNDKIDMPSFPSPEPTISHSNDLDFFKDFENEFLTITYNDDLTSKLTEPFVSFQHIKDLI
ncbi:hypothetical protein Tco_0300542 [Tanacetum coccineum]